MRKRKPAKDDGERWMISYADLLTLMLAFFIVLYSQSQINVSKLKDVARGMIVAFHGDPAVLMKSGHGGSGILKHASAPIPQPKPQSSPAPNLDREIIHRFDLRAKALNQAEAALKRVLRRLMQAQQVSLSRRPLSLRIRLNAELLFPSGYATLTPQAKSLLDRIARVLDKIPHDYPIVVQGYTNSRPIHNAQFPSNWELSVSRAVSVVHLFIAQGTPGAQLSAQGFSKYHPIKSNDTPEGLRINRRVEIVIKSPLARALEHRKSIADAHKPGGNGAQGVAAPGNISQDAVSGAYSASVLPAH